MAGLAKMQKRIFALSLLVALIFGGCSHGNKFLVKQSFASKDFNYLIQRTDEQFKDSSFSNAHWGVFIKSLIAYKSFDKNKMPRSPSATGASAAEHIFFTMAARLLRQVPSFLVRHQSEFSDPRIES